MDLLILGVYALIVWLIFFKFKLLPWNTISQVVVVTIPVVGMFTLIMLLNRFAPSSADVRVIKYTIPIVPQVRGRVIEVPIEPNRPVKRGDVLFRIDPTPYMLQVKTLEAQLANAVGMNSSLREQLKAASAKTDVVRANLDLARLRVRQNREMVSADAGSKFELEAAENEVRSLTSELAASQAAASQITEQLGAVVGGDQAQVAQIKAQLESARWDLSQTTMLSPADGVVVNVQLRPGGYVTAFPLLAPISVVENEYQIYALYTQNELSAVAAGNEAEIVLPTHPGKVIKCSVDSIIWAQGQGSAQVTGTIPQTGFAPIVPGRFPVRLNLADPDKDEFLAAGAIGEGAIYTNRMQAIHILRKVLLRVSTKLNYLILKLH
jgi:multidrug resistance efflux pump